MTGYLGFDMSFDINPPGIPNVPSTGTPQVQHIQVTDFHDLIYNEDIDNVFINQAEFGDTVVNYYHSSLKRWQIYNTIFDNPTILSSIEQADVNLIVPQFQISEYNLLHPILKSDRCIIRNVPYRVEQAISDGVGITTVYLRQK